jgi:DNA polymerase-1
VKLDEVSKRQRDSAKTVNFSIIYGISAFGLSDRLKIERERAQYFIDRYFELYPGVKIYFDNLLKKAREDGFVSTKLGRRRDASGLTASNFRLRAAAEREVINFPIQGGASDMVKRAMLLVSKDISRPDWEGYDMVLQVHDELLFEVPASAKLLKAVKDGGVEMSDIKKLDPKLFSFMKFVRGQMLEANEYDVPMKVDVGVGLNWGNIDEL